MAQRLIDADALRQKLSVSKVEQFRKKNFGQAAGLIAAQIMVIDAQEVDAVPVVRCKDCIHYGQEEIAWCDYHSYIADDGSWFEPDPDDYCSCGERRKDDERH